MVGGTVERLIEYVHERAGDGLRTVVVMNEDSWEVVYLRDDLQQKYSSDTYAAVVDRFVLKTRLCPLPSKTNLSVNDALSFITMRMRA
ncbi:hypothetical protein ACH9L7_11785 [Haloferax sp. S1W]|uniref:hypothetical protein n=1 Tax=Haloferax sp. S1W TaxID=3377110 RepID=UPI0037CB359B